MGGKMHEELFANMPPLTRAKIELAMRDPDVNKWVRDMTVENWMDGYSKAVEEFSIWKDGQQTIGVMKLNPKEIIEKKRADLVAHLGGLP
jgi:hypothetical protein